MAQGYLELTMNTKLAHTITVKSVEWQNLTTWWLIRNNTKKDFTDRIIVYFDGVPFAG